MRNWHVTLTWLTPEGFISHSFSTDITAKTPGDALRTAVIDAVTQGHDETTIKYFQVRTK